MAEIVEMAKLTHHAWANPKAFAEGQTRKEIGTVIGKADKVKVKTMPNGDLFDSLVGEFEATNADTGRITRSGVCYLPSGFQELITAKVKSVQEEGGSVEFAYRVYSIPASHAAGFSYAFEPLLKPQESDALSNLRALAAPKSQAQIEAPKSQAQIETPKGDAGKGKKEDAKAA